MIGMAVNQMNILWLYIQSIKTKLLSDQPDKKLCTIAYVIVHKFLSRTVECNFLTDDISTTLLISASKFRISNEILI